MNRKQIFLLIVLTLTTIGLALGAVYEAQNRAVHTNAAIVKADKQRDAAIAETAQHDKQTKLTVTSLTAQTQNLIQDKAALCAQLKVAKLVNPRCQ